MKELRAEHATAVKDLRAEHVAAAKSAKDLMTERGDEADATASALRAQVEDLRGVVADLRTAPGRVPRPQKPRSSTPET
jgi:ElaB/YqjD/DUF883 family membrane-anchored ribosome-binding protein